MGFFKTFGEEKEIVKLLCRFCDSNKVKYTKHIGWGEKEKIVYHYKAHCKDCKKTWYVKRTKEVFEKVEKKSWIKSKAYINKFGL